MSDTHAILVVEDNPASRKLIRVTLESEGYVVHEAADARSALDWLRDHQPRLILQDLVLPDLDGLELLRRIRKLPHGETVPVLCLSGFIARMHEARSMSDGFAALLSKPIDPIELLDTVRIHFDATPSQDRPEPSHEQVFVVNHDPLQRQLAEYHLASAGFSVTTFASAHAALASALERAPYAIISSLLTPSMGGFELCLSMRQTPTLAGVRVILVSSQPTEPEDHELALQLGADTLAPDGGDWANLVGVLRKAPVDPPRRSLWLHANTARDAILRRTQAQLDRQLRTNASLVGRCMLQNAQLSVLGGLADSLTREPARNNVLSDVLAVCLDLAGIAKGALFLREGTALVPRHVLGFDAAESSALALLFEQAPRLDQTITRGQVAHIPSAATSGSEDLLQRAGVDSGSVVPVAFREKCYGALLLGTGSPEATGHDPLSFARVLGGQVGQAIGLAEAFERLHASEERFRTLLESMDSVTVLDRDQRITGAYGRATTEDAASPRDFLGKPLELMLGEPQTRAQHEAYARALSGQSVVYEWTRGAGASARHFRDALWPVRDAAGEVQSVMRVARDVTDEKRTQAQGMVTNRMASVGMLAAGIAHEINNPLMAVLGNLQLLLDAVPIIDKPADASEQAQSLRDAYDAAKRVEAIVRDLRLFSRSDGDNRTNVDVHSLLDSTLRMARAALRHRARVVKEYGEIPEVLANEPRLGQVFLNLIINAAQALPDSASDTEEIRISTRVDAQGRVLVEVKDTGCGIPEELARRLFTPFLTTKPAGVGTGLGLVICQRIVSSLNGEISFESQVGIGTTFRVLLPAAKPARRSTQARPASQPVTQRGRVLIIDDEALVGNLLTKALGRDHNTHTFSDARKALEHLRADPRVDVILCDLVMPNMSGMELYQALVQTHPELSARVIFLTGGALTQTMLEFLERVPNLHLRKPLNIGELRAVVNDRIA